MPKLPDKAARHGAGPAQRAAGQHAVRALPSVQDLPARPKGSAARELTDARGAGRGLARGTALAGAGPRLLGRTLGRIAENLEASEAQRQRSALADADAAWTAGLIGLGEKYRDDQDYATLADRYDADVDRLREAIPQHLEGEARDAFERRAEVDVARGRDSIGRRAHALAMDATRATLDASLDTYRRAFLEATDANGREQAAAAATAAITAARERGAIDREAAGVLARNFLESAAIGRLQMLPTDQQIAALTSDAVDKSILSAIDPARRAVILRQAEARRDAALRQAVAQRDAALRGDVRDAVAVLERGRTPAGLPALTGAVKDTPFEAPLREAIEDSGLVAAFLQKSIPEQAAELKAAPETTDRRALDRENRMRRAHGALRKQIADGRGLLAAAELGVFVELAPFDLEPETLRRRVIQADLASGHFGVAVAPIMPAESDAVAAQIDAAPADQVTGMLAGLYNGLGREGAMAFVDQVADKRPELALATVAVADRPLLAREIIAGGRLLRDNRDVAPPSEDRQAAIAAVFGTGDRSVFTPDTATALRPIMDAAAALYAGRKVPTGDFSYDDDAYEGALSEVVGGVFRFNGRNILAPVAGMEEDAFEDAMEALKQPDLIEFGNGAPQFADGRPFTTLMFESRFFGAEAQLVTSGFGRYLVSFPGLGYVITGDGYPYELDLGAYIRGRDG